MTSLHHRLTYTAGLNLLLWLAAGVTMTSAGAGLWWLLLPAAGMAMTWLSLAGGRALQSGVARLRPLTDAVVMGRFNQRLTHIHTLSPCLQPIAWSLNDMALLKNEWVKRHGG